MNLMGRSESLWLERGKEVKGEFVLLWLTSCLLVRFLIIARVNVWTQYDAISPGIPKKIIEEGAFKRYPLR